MAHATQPSITKAKTTAASAAEADALYPILAAVGLPEPDEGWDDDAEDPDSWRPPRQEPVFRPGPIGARPADRRAYNDALNAAPRPQPSGESQRPQKRSSTTSYLRAADETLPELRYTPQPSASSSRGLPS